MSTPLADFESHHIQGYARAAMEAGRDGRFSVPLVSHIEGNLYMGGCINGVRLGDDFAHVVSLYPWERYALGPDTSRTEVRLYDSEDIPSGDALDEIADAAHGWLAKGKVLIHCQAGLNRSGLVSALVLRRMGRTSAEAIDLLRARRCAVVLCNETFESYLLSLDAIAEPPAA